MKQRERGSTINHIWFLIRLIIIDELRVFVQIYIFMDIIIKH